MLCKVPAYVNGREHQHDELYFFFFNDPAPPEIYTLPLPALLPIFAADIQASRPHFRVLRTVRDRVAPRLGVELPHLSMGMSDDFAVAVEEGATMLRLGRALRSEEHTSELQSQSNLVCRLLLEKKKI